MATITSLSTSIALTSLVTPSHKVNNFSSLSSISQSQGGALLRLNKFPNAAFMHRSMNKNGLKNGILFATDGKEILNENVEGKVLNENLVNSTQETQANSSNNYKAKRERGQIVAIITGAISIALGVGYLVLVQLLDTRGVTLLPPPPEAFGP